MSNKHARKNAQRAAQQRNPFALKAQQQLSLELTGMSLEDLQQSVQRANARLEPKRYQTEAQKERGEQPRISSTMGAGKPAWTERDIRTFTTAPRSLPTVVKRNDSEVLMSGAEYAISESEFMAEFGESISAGRTRLTLPNLVLLLNRVEPRIIPQGWSK